MIGGTRKQVERAIEISDKANGYPKSGPTPAGDPGPGITQTTSVPRQVGSVWYAKVPMPSNNEKLSLAEVSELTDILVGNRVERPYPWEQ